MSGLRITVPDQTIYRQRGRWRPPIDEDGWEGAFFLGSASGFSQVNRIGGKADATVVGTPTESDHYLSIQSSANYLQTSILEPTEGTYIAVVKSADTLADSAHRPIWIGDFNGSAAPNATLAEVGVNSARMTTAYTVAAVASGSTATIVDDSDAWKCLIADFGAAGLAIYDMTAAVSATTAAPGSSTRTTPTQNLRIGSGVNNTFQGIGDIAFAGILSRRITSDERTTLYDLLQDYYAARSITI